MVIISLAAIMLASMIAASMRIITRSVKGYDLYVAQVNALNTEGRVKSAGEKTYKDDELGYQTETDKNVTITGKVGSGGQIQLSVPVTIYEIKTNGSTELWRYQAG